MLSEHKDVLSPREVFDRFLHAMENNAWNDLAELYAENFIVEHPFARPGFPTRSEDTRETLRTRLESLSNRGAQFEKIDGVVIHETMDPEVIVGEYRLLGKSPDSSRPVAVPCIMVVKVRNGQIVYSRDYTNPIANAVASGRIPDIIATLSAGNFE